MKVFRWAPALSLVAALSGCYVVPVAQPDGRVIYQHYPLPPSGVVPAAVAPTMPAVLNARMYPKNEIAAQTGIITGTVTNLMTGKGQFQVSYMGEVLSGEATRVSNDERRGIASAFSPRGMYMSCEYQMNTPLQGVGHCTFSNGASYEVHLSRD